MLCFKAYGIEGNLLNSALEVDISIHYATCVKLNCRCVGVELDTTSCFITFKCCAVLDKSAVVCNVEVAVISDSDLAGGSEVKFSSFNRCNIS